MRQACTSGTLVRRCMISPACRSKPCAVNGCGAKAWLGAHTGIKRRSYYLFSLGGFVELLRMLAANGVDLYLARLQDMLPVVK